jgi:hypothetical protein
MYIIPTTALQWLDTLPSEVREKALRHSVSSSLQEDCNSLYDALALAFVWENTPDGDEYWRGIANEYTPNFLGFIVRFRDAINLSYVARFGNIKRQTLEDALRDEDKQTPEMNQKVMTLFCEMQRALNEINSL